MAQGGLVAGSKGRNNGDGTVKANMLGTGLEGSMQIMGYLRRAAQQSVQAPFAGNALVDLE